MSLFVDNGCEALLYELSCGPREKCLKYRTEISAVITDDMVILLRYPATNHWHDYCTICQGVQHLAKITGEVYQTTKS